MRYAEPAVRGGWQRNNRDPDGKYGNLDEELATLRPAYMNSKWALERSENSTEAIGVARTCL